mmetsp:Transcript_37903/g.121606  ORF Transcript_37903/g.121606 Transcript_37903/m.121606 type:complete len:221 (+) Transcript_37903:315-977(+)
MVRHRRIGERFSRGFRGHRRECRPRRRVDRQRRDGRPRGLLPGRGDHLERRPQQGLPPQQDRGLREPLGVPARGRHLRRRASKGALPPLSRRRRPHHRPHRRQGRTREAPGPRRRRQVPPLQGHGPFRKARRVPTHLRLPQRQRPQGGQKKIDGKPRPLNNNNYIESLLFLVVERESWTYCMDLVWNYGLWTGGVSRAREGVEDASERAYSHYYARSGAV